MGSRRHHEVSPGGEGQTHREHYDKDERQEDRRERREARQEAREHFRKERDKIREEIDMTHACLPKKLHVRLAEVEELVAQHKKEKLEFELPEDFQKIKAQIEKLADGDDNGVYESDGATKRELRRAMRNDLQTLRLTVRGLRTSLRRHVNHEDEKPEVVVAAPPIIVAPKPPLVPRPPRDRVDLDDGESSGSGANSPETGATPTDPAPAGPISVEVPPVVVGDVTVTTPDDEPGSSGTGSSTPETGEKAPKDGGEDFDEGGDDQDDSRIDKPEKAPEELHEEAIGKLDERLKSLDNPKYDDEFRGWIVENYDTDGINRILETDAKDPFTEAWETYVGELINGVDELLVDEFDVKPEDLNQNVEYFWEYFRKKDEGEFIKTIRNLYKGSGTPEGIAAFETARAIYTSDEFQKELETVNQRKNPKEWLKSSFESMDPADQGGMEVKLELENGLGLGLGESSIQLKFDGAYWNIETSYPLMFKEGVSLRYEDPAVALIDARRILTEVKFIDEVLAETKDREIETEYQYAPFYSEGNHIMAHTHATWNDWGDYDKLWTTRDLYKASEMVDQASVVRALNTSAIETHESSDNPRKWKPEDPKPHFTDVMEILQDRFPNLKVIPNEDYSKLEVSDAGLDGESLTVLRKGESWEIQFPYPEMLNPGVNLNYPDPKTGLTNALTDATVLLKRSNEVKRALEYARSNATTNSPFSLEYKNAGQSTAVNVENFEGKRVVEMGNFFSLNYGEALISQARFMSGLNAKFRMENQATLTLSPAQELESVTWRFKNAFSWNETWKQKTELNQDGATLSITLGDEKMVKVNQSGDKWRLEIDEKFQPLIKKGMILEFDTLDGLINVYNALGATFSVAQSTLERARKLKIDESKLETSKAPFFLDNYGGIRFSDAKETPMYNTLSDHNSYFHKKLFLEALNEMYKKEN